MRRSILWFRNDLRLHDNEALFDALAHNDEVLPVYVIDERTIRGKTSYGFPKMGAFRQKFLFEALTDLRKSLRAKGSDLFVRYGLPEDIIPELARRFKTTYVYCNRERTAEEKNVQDALEKNLWSIGQEMRFYRGKMLYYTADLPFPVTQCPDNFTSFRKEVEKFVPIREPIASPESIPALSEECEPEEFRHHFDFEDSLPSKGTHFRGGETSALRELNYYIWETESIKSYHETRNQLLGRDYSSKFAPYLAHGCLSPKLIYKEVKRFEKEVESNKSTYWLIFELLWRDFFRFMAKKHGNAIFKLEGTKRRGKPDLYSNTTLFEKWSSGNTGIPFVDANMRELNETGFMSNRGRQNVASFLVKDMKINWIWGAEYFESQLVDYDPCSNYGNWNYVAGVGSDPRQDRYFNIPIQAKRYDPKGEFMRYWLPELLAAPNEFLFNPFSRSKDEISIQGTYPNPCLQIKNWDQS